MTVETETVEYESSPSPPRRPDGRRFYGGKRPPGVPASASSAVRELSCRGLSMKRDRSPSLHPASASARLPVAELLSELEKQPTASCADVAQVLRQRYELSDSDTNMTLERLEDLRAAQLAVVKRVRGLLPVEQSHKRLRLFSQDLQELVDDIEAAP